MDRTRDNLDVRSRTELLASHKEEQVKQHLVFDGSSRPILVFTAPISAKNGAPCLCTEYVYLNATSTLVKSRQERIYRWNEVWDTNFIFDPSASYDADGDGSL